MRTDRRKPLGGDQPFAIRVRRAGRLFDKETFFRPRPVAIGTGPEFGHRDIIFEELRSAAPQCDILTVSMNAECQRYTDQILRLG